MARNLRLEGGDALGCFRNSDDCFYSLGTSDKSKEIVVLSCTSGTALANYVPAIAEAYYQHVPLLVLSADRRPLLLNQNEDQMINQPGIFDNFIKMSIDLPEAIGPHTRWGCRRLICEGINELTHHNLGPVHINYRIGDEGFKFEEGIIDPDIGIKLIQELNEENVTTLKNELSKYSRIAILCGQSSVLTQKQCDSINPMIRSCIC